MDLHWGTFQLPGDVSTARQATSNALHLAGLGVWVAEDTEYFVNGGNDTAGVNFTLTPGFDDVHVAIVVSSTNGTAEAVRNVVRELAQGHAPPPLPF